MMELRLERLVDRLCPDPGWETDSGARGRAAAILGIDRKTLYRKLRAYGLDTADDQASPDEI